MIALFRTGFNGVVYGFERSLVEYLVRHYLAHARLRHLLAMRHGVGVETIALQAATDADVRFYSGSSTTPHGCRQAAALARCTRKFCSARSG